MIIALSFIGGIVIGINGTLAVVYIANRLDDTDDVVVTTDWSALSAPQHNGVSVKGESNLKIDHALLRHLKEFPQ